MASIELIWVAPECFAVDN